MRVLLDTHVFLWVLSNAPRLSAEARERIEAADAVFVSAASIWEIAIKASLGKLTADPVECARAITGSGFLPLAITPEHAAHVATLPSNDLHKDPFDRLLVAQSMTEPLILLTADQNMGTYGGLVHLV
jgi:PIN domain nuclease of toxin-antitoxin system